MLAACVALEAGSTHLIARALAAHYARHVGPHPAGNSAPHAASLQSANGAGVAGVIDGTNFRLGNRDYVAALAGIPPPENVAAGATLFLGTAGQWLAAIELADAIKCDALECVEALRRAGLAPHILSGDRKDRVMEVAEALAVPAQSVMAACSPQQKLAYARNLHEQHRSWIAVGDGINDAPFMGAASVSIAIATGADLTRLTADAVLMSPHLMPLATARHVASKMKRVIRQNFAWAIAYNVIALPLAVGGLVSPAWAAIGMASSSLVVVANSMRLLR